jgi:mannose-6-phosphate isomerase-like protein (cupin superfamily)
MIQGKIWGNTECLFDKNNVAVHRIEVNKGYMCSKHYHLHKHNVFYVEKGKLKIEVWQKDYDLVDQTIITDGQSTCVTPGLLHRFSALEDTLALEMYFVELDGEDIIRESCGKSIDT